MSKLNINLNIDWRSKIIDLLIVVLGITIAYKLNTWNESSKAQSKAVNYIRSFSEENTRNEENLRGALEFSVKNLESIDTLKKLLVSKRYDDPRIQELMGTMMALASYSPSVTTMENITASGDFEILQDVELRKKIIDTYNSYKTTLKLETMLLDYVGEYVTPYVFEKVRFSDGSIIEDDFIQDPQFENIVFGYSVLLSQQVNGYSTNLLKVESLTEILDAAKE